MAGHIKEQAWKNLLHGYHPSPRVQIQQRFNKTKNKIILFKHRIGSLSQVKNEIKTTPLGQIDEIS
jgi:hypothetical protein